MKLIEVSNDSLLAVLSVIKNEFSNGQGFCPTHNCRDRRRGTISKQNYGLLYGFRGIRLLGSSVSISEMNSYGVDRSNLFLNVTGNTSMQIFDIFTDFVALTESELAAAPSWRRPSRTDPSSSDAGTSYQQRWASGFPPSLLIDSQYSNIPIFGHSLCHMEMTMRRMDELYGAAFHDFLGDESNRSLIAAHISKIFKDFSFIELARGIAWLTAGWSSTATGELLAHFLQDWAPEMAGWLVRTILILPFHAMIFHGYFDQFLEGAAVTTASTSLPELLSNAEHVEDFNSNQPTHLKLRSLAEIYDICREIVHDEPTCIRTKFLSSLAGEIDRCSFESLIDINSLELTHSLIWNAWPSSCLYSLVSFLDSCVGTDSLVDFFAPLVFDKSITIKHET